MMGDPRMPGFFSGPTVQWFRSAFGEPTPVQREAWPAIASGGHALVSAPTGTGKTLAAFLVYIDQIARELGGTMGGAMDAGMGDAMDAGMGCAMCAGIGDAMGGAEAGDVAVGAESGGAESGGTESGRESGAAAGSLRLIYISPLKSLASDIRENLDKPLEGIAGFERIAALEGAGAGGTGTGGAGAGGTRTGGAGAGDAGAGGTQTGGAGAGDAVTGDAATRGAATGGAATGVAGAGGTGLIRVAVRTGDTTAQERRRMLKAPPHILLTTPESLYLLLTSGPGRRMLRTARAIVIDELHALAGGKRGAHLMLSIARLDALRGAPLQRVGLSATIKPLETAAAYLSPSGRAGDVQVVAPKMEKSVEIAVISPLGAPESGMRDPTQLNARPEGPEGSVWPQIARLVQSSCEGARTAIAFVEGRMQAEKLAHYVNEAAGDGFARTHHGSVSKEARLEAEDALREGRLRLLCATSSMELGIDVGEIDRVLQVGCPRTVSSAMQRLGRAGHNPGRVSVMRMFPRMASEALACGLTAQLAREGGIEPLRPPEQCLDVLAQHLVSMAATESYGLDDVMAMLSRAQPFRSVSRAQAEATLRMLAGDFEHAMDIPVRPRILYDRINERVCGDPYSRLLALSAGGTIPDKGMFTARTESGAKIGELDEEFVFEARAGDKFLLGSFAWRIDSIGKNEVRVSQASPEGAAPPFWKGEGPGRQIETGLAFGAIMRSLGEDAGAGKATLEASLSRLGLDVGAAEAARDLLARQLNAVGALADDRTIIVEHFRDEAGDNQWLAHSIFGRRVNAPLALLAAEAAKRVAGAEMGTHEDDDGFLLFPQGGHGVPPGILMAIDATSARRDLDAMLVSTPLFNMAFRYNASRALMMGARRAGRQPLWVQRLRGARMLDAIATSKGHPLIEETRRECLSDYWDLDGVEFVLGGIQSGAIRVREVFRETPSPMSLALRRAAESVLLYEYSPTTTLIERLGEAALTEARGILAGEAAGYGAAATGGEAAAGGFAAPGREGMGAPGHDGISTPGRERMGTLGRDGISTPGRDGLSTPGRDGMLDAAAKAHESQQAQRAELRRAPKDEQQLHAVLMAEGDMQAGETHAPIEWLESLALQGRALYIEPGLWIAAEHAAQYEDGAAGDAGAMQRIARRALRHRGSHTAAELALRYHWPADAAESALAALCEQKAAIGHGGTFFHADLFDRALRAVTTERRASVRTMPGESYAAYLASRVARCEPAPPSEQAEAAIESLLGATFPAALWESVLLPARVPHYRPALLDALLARGAFCWHYSDGGVSFSRYEDIDWDGGRLCDSPEALDADERVVMGALETRGAMFMQGIFAALGGRSPFDALIGLVEKGLVRADSFTPVRLLIEQGKGGIARPDTRQHARAWARARAGALASGRWELARAPKPQNMETQITRAFGRATLLCRETAAGMLQWDAALRALRVWEYTGRARRGYYIEGLSGAQFIRSEDHAAATAAFAHPQDDIVWLSGADAAQQWGKSLPHLPGRAFTNVPGVAVGLRAGLPVAVFERQGQTLRALPDGAPPRDLSAELSAFSRQYSGRRVYAALKSVAVKQCPDGAAAALLAAGFAREPSGYVLYPSAQTEQIWLY